MANGRVTASVTPDHIVPLAHGGTDDDANVQCLCLECHDAKTRADFGQRAARPRIGIDGWPIDAD
jgi:5-methylcytosine-specific restriction protein A